MAAPIKNMRTIYPTSVAPPDVVAPTIVTPTVVTPTPSSGGFSVYPTTLTPPVSGNFTWSNPNSYSKSTMDLTGRMLISIGASAAGLALMQMPALPAYPYTIDLALTCYATSNIILAEIALANNSGAIRSFGLRTDSSPNWHFSDQSWTNITTPGSENSTSTYDGMTPTQSMTFARITDDGTNRKIWWSKNGKDYLLVTSQASGAGITPTKAGLLFYSTSGLTTNVTVYHWAVTNSILPQNAANGTTNRTKVGYLRSRNYEH